MSRNTFDLGGVKPIKVKPLKMADLGLGYQKEGKRVSKAIIRRIVWKRDKGTCRLCGIKIRAGEDWDLARNRAGKSGGGYTVKNCFVAHHSCNISQGTKTRGQVKREIGREIGKKKSKRKRNRSQGQTYINPLTGKREKFDPWKL